MFFALILLVLLACVFYFYFLWLWFLALLPLVFLLWWLIYSIAKTPLSFSKLNIGRYGFYIAWFVILLAVYGILSFVNIWSLPALLWIVSWNAVFMIVSYILNYKDWINISKFGYYLWLWVLLLMWLWILPMNLRISLITMLLSLHFWFIWFLKFIIGIWTEIEKSYLYNLFVSALLLLSVLILSWIGFLPLALALISVILLWLYLWLWRFVQKIPNNRGRISVRRILAGEKVLNKTFFSNDALSWIYDFVVNMPQIYRYVLEFLNVLLVLILFVFFISNWAEVSSYHHLFYWIVISVFIGNILLLKKIQYTSSFQNFFLFVVINFAVYVNLFSYFESNIKSVVLWSVIWNIFTSILLFVLPKKYRSLFNHKDYWYWIVASILVFLMNVFLLLKSGMAGELIFFLLLLYVWIESMLIFYGIKYVENHFWLED